LTAEVAENAERLSSIIKEQKPETIFCHFFPSALSAFSAVKDLNEYQN
jgi:hypothetical protein